MKKETETSTKKIIATVPTVKYPNFVIIQPEFCYHNQLNITETQI